LGLQWNSDEPKTQKCFSVFRGHPPEAGPPKDGTRRVNKPPAATEGEFKIDEQPILSKYAEQRILQILESV
jgi:hypothetical protein